MAPLPGHDERWRSDCPFIYPFSLFTQASFFSWDNSSLAGVRAPEIFLDRDGEAEGETDIQRITIHT